jgi:hypothetical protein
MRVPDGRENHMRQKTNFAKEFNPNRLVKPFPQKYSSFVFSENGVICCRPVSIRGALRGRHER